MKVLITWCTGIRGQNKPESNKITDCESCKGLYTKYIICSHWQITVRKLLKPVSHRVFIRTVQTLRGKKTFLKLIKKQTQIFFLKKLLLPSCKGIIYLAIYEKKSIVTQGNFEAAPTRCSEVWFSVSISDAVCAWKCQLTVTIFKSSVTLRLDSRSLVKLPNWSVSSLEFILWLQRNTNKHRRPQCSSATTILGKEVFMPLCDITKRHRELCVLYFLS